MYISTKSRFSFLYFLGGIQSSQLDSHLAPMARLQWYIYTWPDQPFLYCKANQRTWICYDWLTHIVSIIGNFCPFISLQLLLACFLKGLVACLASQTFWHLDRNSHPLFIPLRQWQPRPEASCFWVDFPSVCPSISTYFNPSVRFLWKGYLTNTLRGFGQIYQNP